MRTSGRGRRPHTDGLKGSTETHTDDFKIRIQRSSQSQKGKNPNSSVSPGKVGALLSSVAPVGGLSAAPLLWRPGGHRRGLGFRSEALFKRTRPLRFSGRETSH